MIDCFKVVLLLAISFFISFFYMESKEYQLINEINKQFRFLSDSIYRYQINVFNSKNEKIQTINSDYLISFKSKNENIYVNAINENVQELYFTLKKNPLVGERLWTVADIYSEYMYIKPFRNEYVQLIEKHIAKGGYFNHLLDIENIGSDLKSSKSEVYETIKVYGPYLESKTKESLYTIYYPLYFDRSIKSIFLIDIQSSFLSDFIYKFNFKHFTAFKLNVGYKEHLGEYISKILALKSNDKDITLPLRVSYCSFILLFITIYIGLYLVVLLLNKILLYIKNNKIDKLTGFYRKDHFNGVDPVVSCILVIDIDHFKKVNDTYGHTIGDKVITEVSRRIRGTIRTSDIGIRWGGEEFVVILDGKINVPELENRLNELLKVISDELIFDLTVTISIGALSSTKGMILSDAFKCADEALYISKREGRNKFTIYESIR